MLQLPHCWTWHKWQKHMEWWEEVRYYFWQQLAINIDEM